MKKLLFFCLICLIATPASAESALGVVNDIFQGTRGFLTGLTSKMMLLDASICVDNINYIYDITNQIIKFVKKEEKPGALNIMMLVADAVTFVFQEIDRCKTGFESLAPAFVRVYEFYKMEDFKMENLMGKLVPLLTNGIFEGLDLLSDLDHLTKLFKDREFYKFGEELANIFHSFVLEKVDTFIEKKTVFAIIPSWYPTVDAVLKGISGFFISFFGEADEIRSAVCMETIGGTLEMVFAIIDDVQIKPVNYMDIIWRVTRELTTIYGDCTSIVEAGKMVVNKFIFIFKNIKEEWPKITSNLVQQGIDGYGDFLQIQNALAANDYQRLGERIGDVVFTIFLHHLGDDF